VPAEPDATADGPARRRPSWNLKTIVEDVGGRPIADFQDPARPVHPYLQGRYAPTGSLAARSPESEDLDDPVGRVYPPLTGATGRSLYGKAGEHHSPTLASVPAEPGGSLGRPPHPPGPSHRPERIYLHYLLLHLDRLNDSALAYLAQAVREERQHRSGALPAPAHAAAPPPLPAPPPAG
jgi:hypothetical protein